jgi:hypothetical protein
MSTVMIVKNGSRLLDWFSAVLNPTQPGEQVDRGTERGVLRAEPGGRNRDLVGLTAKYELLLECARGLDAEEVGATCRVDAHAHQCAIGADPAVALDSAFRKKWISKVNAE